MLKIIGICILLFTLVHFVGRVADTVRARVETLREIGELLIRIRKDVGCYLLPLSDILSTYSSPRLSECGFLNRLLTGLDPAPSLVGKYRVPDGAKRIVSDLFTSFGEGYADDVIRSLDQASAEISKILAKEDGEAKKRIKLYSVLSSAAGIGALILFI